MRKNRFAKLLLTGKVATLPVLIGQVRADVTPTYSDMIGSDLRVIEVPSGSAIRLHLSEVARVRNEPRPFISLRSVLEGLQERPGPVGTY